MGLLIGSILLLMMSGLKRVVIMGRGRQEDMISFEAKYIHQTDEVLKVDIEGEVICLPKIAIKYDEDELECAQKGNIISIEISEKLATDKQLI
jgi:hypothetical protein